MSYTADITAIIKKYIAGQALNSEEAKLLEHWSDQPDNKRLLEELLNEEELARQLSTYEALLANKETNRKRLTILTQPTTPTVIKTPERFVWLRYAAILILLAGAALIVYRFNQHNTNNLPKQTTASKPAIMLTLADGSKINLDETPTGKIATEQQTDITLNNNALAYNSKTSNNTHLAFNTIEVPRGRQIQLILADGSKVWLNAGSVFTYPSAFKGTRNVDLQGEAFFEINKDAAHPFTVNTPMAIINVLGTSFNVSAYQNDSSIYTTVLQGTVQTVHAESSTLLHAGEQSRLLKGNNSFTINKADAEGISSWRKGLFYFHNRTLPDVMRDIERWYDIQIIYPATIPSIQLEGKLSRSLPLIELIKFLEGAGLQLNMRNDKTLEILAN